MKTALKLTSAVMALALCASAFADPSKPTVRLAKQNSPRKSCYAVITGSDIPQPCERLSTIPTTADCMLRIGAQSSTR